MNAPFAPPAQSQVDRRWAHAPSQLAWSVLAYDFAKGEHRTHFADWIDWLASDGWREDAADYEAKVLEAMRTAIAKATGAA